MAADPPSLGPLQPQEFPALAELHRLCFGDRGDIERLLKQRYGPEAGPRSEVVVARDGNNRLVGAQAMTWLPALWKGRHSTLGMMTLGMVHPQFRRRGLFRQVVEEAGRLGWEGGADLQFTLPNDRSEPAFASFEAWKNGEARRTRLLLLDPGKLVGDRVGLGQLGSALWSPLRLATRWSRSKSDGVEEVSDLAQCAEGLDRLAQRIPTASGDLMLIRDTAFCRWRYVDCPLADYRFFVGRSGDGIDGLVVTTTQPRFGSTLGFVVDLLSDAGSSRGEELLRCAVRSLWEQGAAAAIFVGRMPAQRPMFRRAGFLDVTAVYPRSFHTYYSRPSDPDTEALPFDPETDWCLSLADFDSV